MNAPFQVIELRRFRVAGDAREEFASHDASVLGHFFERGNGKRFTWLRGFADMDKAQMNRDLLDGDEVLLMRPLSPDTGLCALPAVDPQTEPAGAQGIVVAQIFKAKGSVESLYRQADPWFAGYGGRGVTEAGILGSIDGQQLAWLGILRDQVSLALLKPALDYASMALEDAGATEGPAELLILDPAARSRMRWIGVAEARAAA